MKGVLLINLGSPDSTRVRDVRRYLGEFLMDERVIDIPYWKRLLLVKGIILNVRPKKSAKAYKKIWWDEGSPLIILSERFKEKVSKLVDVPVSLAMRYGSMSIQNGFQELVNKGVKDIFIVPLYPHYAMSSYETVVVKVRDVKKAYFPETEIEVLAPFYNRNDYVNALSSVIKENLDTIEYDHILFSYHGIPERHIFKTDKTGHCKIDENCCNMPGAKAHEVCYRHQCLETTKLIASNLNLEADTYSNSFQSRLLKDPWLKPYTDFELERLAKNGVKRLAVITPAFVADCLETLEEIAMEGKEEFLEAGGEQFHYIPCLNDNEVWVNTMVSWINNYRKNK